MADPDKPKKTKGSLDLDAVDPKGTTSFWKRAFKTPGGDPWRMPQDLPWSGIGPKLDVVTEDATRALAHDLVDIVSKIGSAVWEAGPATVHEAYAGEIDPMADPQSPEGRRMQEKARETAFLIAGQGPAGARELGEGQLIPAAREVVKDYYTGTEPRTTGIGSIAEAYRNLDPKAGEFMGIGPWGISRRDLQTGAGAAKAIGQDIGDIAQMLWNAGPQAIHDVLTGKLDPMSPEGQAKARNLALMMSIPSPVRGPAGTLHEGVGPLFHGAARPWEGKEFNPRDIGSGEGEHFQGWGANVTDSPELAKVYKGEGGKVYQLELPHAQKEEFLHLRKSHADQSPQMKAAIAKLPIQGAEKMTGYQILHAVEDTVKGGPKKYSQDWWDLGYQYDPRGAAKKWKAMKAAEIMAKAGIKGTRIDAGDVLSTTKGHSSYVAFTPKNLKLVGTVGLAALLGVDPKLFGDDEAKAAQPDATDQDRVRYLRDYYAAHPGEV